jgi:glycosyltransferase involved in cell wall biosynthesis
MRIAFVLPPIEPYSPRGLALSTVVRHTAAELMAEGHAVSVLSVPDSEGLYDGPETVAIPTVRRGGGMWSRLQRRRGWRSGWQWPDEDRWVRATVRTLRSLPKPVDAVVTMNDLVLHGALEKVLPEARRVTWLENELPASDRARARARDDVEMLACCSDYIRRHAIEGGVARESVSVVNNGVDVSAFKQDPLDARRGTLRLLFVGRVEPNKGPDGLVRAFRMARRAGSSAELTLAGPLTSYSLSGTAYESWSLALLDEVRQLGGRYAGLVQRADLPDLYRSHDVTFVLSRAEEPFGLVALEALACGNLVVTSGRGGLVEATGGHGLVVDPDDIDAIAALILDIEHHPDKFDSLRQRGAAWAATRSWSCVAADLLSALSDVRR